VILPVSPRLTSSGSSMVSRSSQRRLQILRYAYLVDSSRSGFRLLIRRARQEVEAPKQALDGERVRRDPIIRQNHSR
jgi:hypothetical protein